MPVLIRRALSFAAVRAVFGFWAAAVASEFAAPGAAPAPDAKDWPMYNRDVIGTRHNPAETALSPGNVGGLVEKWRFPARGSSEEIGVVHATPAVVNGYVYFGTATRPAFYKLAPDGKLVWSYRNPTYPKLSKRPAAAGPGAKNAEGASGPGAADKAGVIHRFAEDQPNAGQRLRVEPSARGIFTSALVTKDTVYFGDLGGWFYALDRATGAERWKVNARAEGFPGAHPMNVFFASPILAEGKIVAGGGTLEQLIAGGILYRGSTGRGFVVAFDAATGRVAWKHDVGPKPEKLDPPVKIEDSWGVHTFYYGPATSSVWSTPSYDAEGRSIYFGTDVNTAPRRPTKDDPRNFTRESCAIVALNAADGSERWVTQLNPGDVWTNSMRSYDPKEGLYKDQSIGDTPKVYRIEIDGRETRVVGVGCKNGGFYVLDASSGKVLAETPTYHGPPSEPLSPAPSPRMLALPSCIGGLQTGCATDGKTIFTNGIDALRLGSQDRPRNSAGPPTGGRVVALGLDTKTEHWRHERPGVAELGGPPPKPLYKNVGDPVASGLAVAGGVVYFTTVASGKLVALDAKSGRSLKEIAIGPVWSGPSVSRGRVYVGTGNTLFSPSEYESFFPKKYLGEVYSFGLPEQDEVDRMGGGTEPARGRPGAQ